MFFNFVATLKKDSRKEVETGISALVYFWGPSVATPTPIPAWSVVQEGPECGPGATRSSAERIQCPRAVWALRSLPYAELRAPGVSVFPALHFVDHNNIRTEVNLW